MFRVSKEITQAWIAKAQTRRALQWLFGYQAFCIPPRNLPRPRLSCWIRPRANDLGRPQLAGITAIPIASLAARNQLPAWAIQIWNKVGIALLLNIMTILILSLAIPIRQFREEPANVFVTQIPCVGLPALLVPSAWFGHIALFRRQIKL